MDTDYSLPDVSIQPNKPPGFDGYNYPFWKFKNFIKASGLRIWDVIEHGNNVPLDDEGFAKPRSRFTNEDYALVELNHKAVHYIKYALSRRSFIG